MTIESSLRIESGGEVHILWVKMIRIDLANYFFIRDKDRQTSLLGSRVLELTYTGSFSLTEFAGIVRSPGIPAEIVNAVQNELLKNEQFWL